MNVRTTFLNGDFVEDAYMSQPTGFEEVGEGNMICKLYKSIYSLNQGNVISSLMKLSSPMVLRRASSINAYI